MVMTFFAAIGLVSVLVCFAVGLVGLVGLFEFIKQTDTRLGWQSDRLDRLSVRIDCLEKVNEFEEAARKANKDGI